MLSAIVRRPVALTENPPILVLLHGLGSNEHDLMGLAPELDPRLLVVAIRGPVEIGTNAYAWYEVTWDADGIHGNSEQALASRDLVMETLKALPEALGVTPSQLLLGGFSQGAILSIGTLLADPTIVSGVLAMSGRLVPEFVPPTPPPAALDVPVLVQHGTRDEVLPVAGSREIRDYLQNAGFAVTYHEYPMAHEISQASLGDIQDWITARLAG